MSDFKELENVLIANYAILYERFYASMNIVTFPFHWHKRVEILHIIKGTLEIVMDEEVLMLNENDFCYIHPSTAHKGTSRSDDLEYEMVQFRESELQQVLSSNRELAPLAEGNIRISRQFQDDYIATLFHHVSDYYKMDSAFQNTLFIGITYEIYGHLAMKHSTVEKAGIYSNDNFSTALKHIEKHYAEITSIADLAQLFSFEPTYFSRTFKKKMGVPANYYICCLKLDEAEKLLTTTDTSIEVISQECGFNSASYFTKCFKKRYGLTPVQYRESAHT